MLRDLNEAVCRSTIPVVAAWRALVILVQAVVHAPVVDVSQRGRGAERDQDGQMIDLHGRRLTCPRTGIWLNRAILDTSHKMTSATLPNLRRSRFCSVR